jgi:lysine biosynthesis protein LysW
MTDTIIVHCPECDGELTLDKGTMMHEILSCEHCGVELEVASTKPYTLKLAPEVQEDWGE